MIQCSRDFPNQITDQDRRQRSPAGLNADLRESTNVECWPAEQVRSQAGAALSALRRQGKTRTCSRATRHGFISSQREGSDLFATIDPDSPVIVLLTAWQYSHHLAPSLAKHKGPVLLLANFDGTWLPRRHAGGRHADQLGQELCAPVVERLRTSSSTRAGFLAEEQ
jgi:hypothetical protein